MPRSRKSNSTRGVVHPVITAGKRITLRELQENFARKNLNTPKTIDVRQSMRRADTFGARDSKPLYLIITAWAGRLCFNAVPPWLAVGAMLGLIFGGCCSNVFALEAIVKAEPESGLLLTFVQFVFIALTSYVSQFDRTRPPLFIKPNNVPIRRWIVNINLFFAINVLNNYAFSYNISIPIHIILRSGGSITTLIAGYIWGKRFTQRQIAAVTLLTLGVIIAASSEPKSKESVENSSISPFSTGIGILFVAQILSAIMGLYTEETYRMYGPYWRENLFYCHLLALPLFIPFFPAMKRQFLKLAASPPLKLSMFYSINSPFVTLEPWLGLIRIPSQLTYLTLNVLTQYACIRGVNLLASVSSALTVTIVLNTRKLVSLLLSIWLFGNRLSPGTMIGACIVFFAGGMYGLEGTKKPSSRRITPVK